MAEDPGFPTVEEAAVTTRQQQVDNDGDEDGEMKISDDSISIDESKLNRSAHGDNRRLSLGDSFSIESEGEDGEYEDGSSPTDHNSDAVEQQHPTVVAYESDLRKSFAAVCDAAGGQSQRRTSDDWEEDNMIQKNVMEEELEKSEQEIFVPTLTTVAATSIEDSLENGTVHNKSRDRENNLNQEVDTNARKSHKKANDEQVQRQQRGVEPMVKSKDRQEKRIIMALSILLVMGLVLILGLVIGLKKRGSHNLQNNLQGEENNVPTVPTSTGQPNTTSTSNTDAESDSLIMSSTAATTEAAVAISTAATAAINSTTSLVCSDMLPTTDCASTSLQLLQKCSSSDTTSNDRYGISIAMSVINGQDLRVLAVVGATNYFDDHAATLLSYDKSTRTWSHVSNLNYYSVGNDISSNSSVNVIISSISYDRFGSAVAISSEWIAISFPSLDMSNTGSVTLYRVSNAVHNGDNVVPDYSVAPDDGQMLGSRFGSSLALDENLLVIGAVRDRNYIGSVYIYRYDDDGWGQVAKLQPDDVAFSESQGNFGHSVAISQGVIIVGAPNDTVNNKERCGSVYIFQEAPGGFAFVQKISPEALLAGDQFGYTVTVDVAINPTTDRREDRIAIGTHLDDDKGNDSGSVYTYLRRDGEREFSLEQKLIPSQWSPRLAFGSSLDMQGHRMIVGSVGYGVAYLFEHAGGLWIEVGSTNDVDSGRVLGDDFGSSVGIASWEEISVDGDGDGVGVFLVGAPLNDEAGEDSGRIYSYAICN
jgi:hypothetical protein